MKKNLTFPTPCLHCLKENENKWCYEYHDSKNVLYAVCKRQAQPANGWEETEYLDAEGSRVYRQTREIKARRSDGFRFWEYQNRSGHPMVRVCRSDSEGKRTFWQEHWDGKQWKKGLNGLERHHIPIFNYQEVQNGIRQGETIWITEGEEKARILAQFDLVATCNLGGSGKWRKSDTEDLTGAAKIILCPDRDKVSKKHFENLYIELRTFLGCKVQWMPAKPESPFWRNLPADGGLDVADWVLEGATLSDIMAAVTDFSPFQEVKPTVIDVTDTAKIVVTIDDDDDDGKPRKLSTRNLFYFIEDNYDLKFNELLNTVELNGEEYDVDEAYLDLAIDHNIKASKATAADLFIRVAKKNSYHPIKQYLEGLNTIEPANLDNLSSRFFGTDNPLYDVFLKKILIAAVARLYKPGCKVDNALVLQGKQGVGKSSFFQILAGDWFSDSMGSGAERDDLLILHQNWILEWGEIEKLFGKKSAAELKPFITRQSDNFREPYARKSRGVKRQCVLVGSTNKTEFLADETGNRRFWVIPIRSQKIDLTLLKLERDAIWKAALEAYNAGEKWYLSHDEEALNVLNNEQFAVSDTWEEEISLWLRDKFSVTVKQVLDDCIKAELKEQDAKAQGRVRDVLTRLGWIPGLEGKSRRRVWLSPKKEGGDQQVITPDHPSDHPLEPSPAEDLSPLEKDQGDQGDHPKTQNFIFEVGQKVEVYNYTHKCWVPTIVEERNDYEEGESYYQLKGGYYMTAHHLRLPQNQR